MTADNFTHGMADEQDRIHSLAFLISASVCILFCVILANLDFGRPRRSVKIDLERRINPNDASLASLIRLPGIGVGRAEAIIAYRKRPGEKNGNDPVFGTCDDLQEVKGIGPKTVRNIDRWLKFE